MKYAWALLPLGVILALFLAFALDDSCHVSLRGDVPVRQCD